MELRGIDLSHNNSVFNWAAVAGQIDLAILRCGYGDDIQSQDDRCFMDNVVGCRNNNIPIGIYLYSYATDVAHAISEAEHVIRTCQGINITYPIFIDMEDDTTKNVGETMQGDIAEAFINRLAEAGYNNVGIYASKNWFETVLTDPRFNNWQKWVARYNSELGYDGSNIVGWQYSSKGSVAGIKGNVDMNIFYQENSNVVEATGSEYPYVARCTGNGVRVREGAGTECTPIFTLYKDNLVDVLGKSYSETGGIDWYYVNIVGLKGYVHPDYIERV